MRVPPLALAEAVAAAQRLIARPVRPSGLLRSLSAGALGATSAALLVASVHEFRRSQTTVNPMSPEQATSLVITGPHQLSRNPMYVGMAGLLAAHAAARGSWPAALSLLGFVGVIDRVQIPAEEAALREQFGSEFSAYAARVPRWLVL